MQHSANYIIKKYGPFKQGNIVSHEITNAFDIPKECYYTVSFDIPNEILGVDFNLDKIRQDRLKEEFDSLVSHSWVLVETFITEKDGFTVGETNTNCKRDIYHISTVFKSQSFPNYLSVKDFKQLFFSDDKHIVRIFSKATNKQITDNEFYFYCDSFVIANTKHVYYREPGLATSWILFKNIREVIKDIHKFEIKYHVQVTGITISKNVTLKRKNVIDISEKLGMNLMFL